jgi:hypothetical protein
MQGSGVLTDSDLAEVQSRCANDPGADPTFDRICDLSDVSEVRVSDETLDAWAVNPISNPPVRHAIICKAPAIAKRVFDYVKLSRRNFREVSIFPSYEKAVEWLGKSLQSH